jgi:hypothetical protein
MHQTIDILPQNFSRTIRQLASVTFVGTVAWDYARSPEIISLFSTWTLLIHFIYFQLPLQSRAIPYFHSISFVGANVMPVLYGFLILWRPRLEVDHMNDWELSWDTIIARAVLIHLAPIIFHSLDLATNQTILVLSYHAIAKKIIFTWTCFSFGIFAMLHSFTYPNGDEVTDLQGITKLDFIRSNTFLFLIANAFAVILLYFLIFRKSIRSNNANKRPSSTPRRNSPVY